MSYKLPAAVAMVSAGLAGLSQASDDVYKMDNIVVTASRTAQTIDQALAPVTVITREDIERSQAKDVTELLNKVPGMQIATSGGMGSKAGIYLRGTRTAQTLVLIDGVMTRSGDFGEAPLQYLDPDQIERIEVVRGPKSSLYGPNAVGGVIHIITRQGKGDPRLRLKVGGGSHGTGEYALNYGGEVDGTKFNLGARLYETRGFDRTLTSEGVDGDDDAYRNKSISGNVSRRFANDMEAGFRFSHATGKSEYDNNDGNKHQKGPYSLFDVTNISGFVTMPVTQLWNTKLD
ncbi:MAG: TonB-dependent receptor, partial [Endozoicomonas sp.]